MTTPHATSAPAAVTVSTRTCVLAALPAFVLALLFTLALWDIYLPLMGPSVFGPLLQVEFLALMATLFMGVVALPAAANAEQALGRRLLFWGIFGIFLMGATGSGWRVGIGFIAVMAATNVGVLLTWNSHTMAVQLLARCFVSFFLLLFCLLLAGQRDEIEHWRATDATYLAGAFYFGALALLEMKGLFLRGIPRLFTGLAPETRAEFAQTAAQLRAVQAATGRQAVRAAAWLQRRAGRAPQR